MSTFAGELATRASHPVQIRIPQETNDRNRLTTAFRLILAVPHLILVGGPIALALSGTWNPGEGGGYYWSAGGLIGAVAAGAAFISWFAIVFTGNQPKGLWNLGAFYLRWRVRAVSYIALLTDKYPPFGDEPYPAVLELDHPATPRNRLTVGLRIILAIPHLIAVWALGIAWAFSTIVAWCAILFTGRYPAGLYDFAVGVLRWNVRVEAYVLLLRDEYPPFSLE
jgi:hypothetical protein